MAIRSAVRSRVVVVLLALLVLAIIGLPLTVKGDGTAAGEVRVLLSYTLGLVTVILAVATLWAGCAAVSLEVQQKQIQLVLAKPVGRLEVWLGKWLGLLALNAVLLAFSGAVVYGLLQWQMRPGRLTAAQRQLAQEQLLMAARRVLPDVSALEDAARQTVEQQIQANAMPEGIPADQFYQAVRDSILQRANTVPIGMRTRWVFRLPERPTGEQALTIRYKFATSKTDKTPVTGLWRAGAPETDVPYEARVTAEPDKTQTVTVPASVVGKDGTVLVEFGNVNPSPVTVLFSPRDGVELLVRAGGFEANLARSLIVVFCQLAFLAALAVTLGSLFSLPVAAFATGSLLVLIKAGSYVDSLAKSATPIFGAAAPPNAKPQVDVFDLILRSIFKGLAAVLRPLQETSPLEHLASGQLVGWEVVGSVFAIKVILYSGILAVLGVWLFNRREIALPA